MTCSGTTSGGASTAPRKPETTNKRHPSQGEWGRHHSTGSNTHLEGVDELLDLLVLGGDVVHGRLHRRQRHLLALDHLHEIGKERSAATN